MSRRTARSVAVVGAAVLGLSLAAPASAVPATSDALTAVGQPSSAPSGAAWEEQSTTAWPGRAANAAVAFDAAAQRMILFGGYDAFVYSSETWSWDGNDWTLLDTPTHPTGRNRHAMAYDPVRDEIVLIGGQDHSKSRADTWVFTDGTWIKRHDVGQRPGRLLGAAMTFDPNLQQVVLFGGYDNRRGHYGLTNATWTWDGSTWTRLEPASSPSPRWDSELAYDPSRNALVLFGGNRGDEDYPQSANDTWVWDGTTWSEEVLTRSPSARYRHGLVTWGEHVVMFGGRGDVHSDRDYGDTWVLESGAWRRLGLSPAPSRRNLLNLGWDSVRGEAVLYGAYRSERPYKVFDTWTLTP